MKMLNRIRWGVVAGAIAMVFACACSDDGASKPHGEADGTLYPDLGQAPDFAQKTPCEGEWIDALGAQDQVSKGKVETRPTVSGNVWKMTVDASAGGTANAAQNPFVYISFENGNRVDITDLASRSSMDWDIAIKRTVIRVNGGDSGPGHGAAAAVAGKTIETVAASDATAFRSDDYLDDKCNVARDPINQVQTAFSGSDLSQIWYAYDMSGSGQAVQPKPWVYVVKRANGKLIKLAIETYYNAQGRSGHYTIYWAAL
jgi:hypothetical protein